jgi:hypothetical protein
MREKILAAINSLGEEYRVTLVLRHEPFLFHIGVSNRAKNGVRYDR